MNAAFAAWWTGLIVVVLLVPLTIRLLHRTLTAARSIQDRLQRIEQQGAQIVTNTAVAPALIDTAGHARFMREIGEKMNAHGAEMAAAFAPRASQGGAQ